MGRISFLAAGLVVLGAAACVGDEASEQPGQDSVGLDLYATGKDKQNDKQNDDQIFALVRQDNLTADRDRQRAAVVDPDLVNPWGLTFTQGVAPVAWLGLNGAGLLGVYNANGNPSLKVGVPLPKRAKPPAAPTGLQFNADGPSRSDDIIIGCSEDGLIFGWQPGSVSAVTRADGSKRGAIYKGLALATVHGQARTYAADFHNGRIDVFDGQYMPVPLKYGAFVDRDIPHGFAPFNIVEHNNFLYVTYAKQDRDAEDDVAGPGNGFIDLFEADGDFIDRVVTRGVLNSPWGIAFIEPTRYDRSTKLLVGNFGDGRINVFELSPDFYGGVKSRFLGALGDKPRHALEIEGLWSIVFGGGGDFSPNLLYFTAGPDDEKHGLFGSITFK